MFIKIRDVCRKPNGHLYIHIDQWDAKAEYTAGLPPPRCTSYETNIQSHGSQVIRDDRGFWKAATGDFIDPESLNPNEAMPEWEREPVVIDIRARILEGIQESFVSMVEQGLTGCYCADREDDLYREGKLIGTYLGRDTTLVPVLGTGLIGAEREV